MNLSALFLLVFLNGGFGFYLPGLAPVNYCVEEEYQTHGCKVRKKTIEIVKIILKCLLFLLSFLFTSLNIFIFWFFLVWYTIICKQAEHWANCPSLWV